MYICVVCDEDIEFGKIHHTVIGPVCKKCLPLFDKLKKLFYIQFIENLEILVVTIKSQLK